MGKAKGDKSEKTSKADAGGTSPEYPDFDLDNPELPPEIEARALPSNDFPYEKTLKRKVYEAELQQLQLELIKAQDHVQAKGERIVLATTRQDGDLAALKRYFRKAGYPANAVPSRLIALRTLPTLGVGWIDYGRLAEIAAETAGDVSSAA